MNYKKGIIRNLKNVEEGRPLDMPLSSLDGAEVFWPEELLQQPESERGSSG
jgi:hypothetical protein